MRLIKIVLPIAALAAAIFFLYSQFFSESKTDTGTVAGIKSISPALDKAKLSISGEGDRLVVKADQSDDNLTVKPVADGISVTSVTGEPDITGVSKTDYPDLFGYEVGVADISEDEFVELVERLRNDPVLLADVLNELRAETEPERLKRLVIMLGATGSAKVLPAAEEMVYSSDAAVRKSGLNLLNRVAPQNPEVYDIANAILGSEADPDVLVSTMNVLAQPKNAGSEARAAAITQIMPLANHESAAVRRHSVAILVRLTNDETLSPTLYNALSDSDASVRKAAAYAYAKYPYQTSEAVERLIEIIEDPSEERGVRQGAILAVSKMSPDEATTERIDAARRQMRDALQSQ